jgi:hypothetical protein
LRLCRIASLYFYHHWIARYWSKRGFLTCTSVQFQGLDYNSLHNIATKYVAHVPAIEARKKCHFSNAEALRCACVSSSWLSEMGRFAVEWESSDKAAWKIATSWRAAICIPVSWCGGHPMPQSQCRRQSRVAFEIEDDSGQSRCC